MENKKVLLRISNLKQYFPVKSNKKLFVKANDGISLDIYEGETLGLVGESGCGKSTFGRVLLQLYHQTQGRTMYYGQSIDSIAPSYFYETVKHLDARLKTMKELKAKSDILEKEVSEMKKHVSDETSEAAIKLFDKMEEHSKAKKLYDDAYLNIVQIIGGLLVAPDLASVSRVFLERYDAAVAHCKEQEKLDTLLLESDELSSRLTSDKVSNKSAIDNKLKALGEKISAQKSAVDQKQKMLDVTHQNIEKLRSQYASNAEFGKHDKHRDDGIDLARLTYSEMRHLRSDMQMIFQDPYSSLNPRMTVGQIVGEGLITHGYYKNSDDRMQEYVMQVMQKCGLSSYMIHRYPHQFSGGQRQRIGIARSLAVKPKFVVCDEAVSALDVSIQSQVINLLQDLKEEENLTYLFISHDLSVVKYISDRIGVMYLGNLVELAKSEDLFERPTHPYTEALLTAIPTTDIDKPKNVTLLEGDIPSPINPPKGCKFHTRCRYCTDICKQVTPEFIEIETGHFVACHHRT